MGLIFFYINLIHLLFNYDLIFFVESNIEYQSKQTLEQLKMIGLNYQLMQDDFFQNNNDL